MLRQSNTTFVNLRAALDDLEPLVNTAKPATKELAPFLEELRPIFRQAGPVHALPARSPPSGPGQANDAVELLQLLPAVQRQASSAFPHAAAGAEAFQPNLNFIRAYTPDLFNGIAKIGQVTGYYDGNGHYARASVSMQNLFKRRRRHPEADHQSRTVHAVRLLRAGQPPLPGRRHPERGRRLQPVRRRQQRRTLRMQPRRRAPRPMIRRLIPVVILVAIVVGIVLLVSGGGSSSDGYRVRAVFDNGAFMVTGEQVRVAGANVGEIESVSVSRPGEPVAYKNGKPVAVPGKAIIVMSIEDPGFQDFRKDASCLIRPQSLIGEKFVDCRPSLPRAPGSPAAAAAEEARIGARARASTCCRSATTAPASTRT